MNICHLTVTAGQSDQLQQIFLIHEDEQRTLGRSSLADIRLLDELVSGHHAFLFYRDKRFWIRELLPLNGLHVNGEMIQEHCLRSFSTIGLGHTELSVEIRESDPVSRPRSTRTSLTSRLPSWDPIEKDTQGQLPPIKDCGESIPLAQKIGSSRDLLISRLALEKGLLNHAQIEKSILLQREMTDAAIQMTLVEIFVDRELLSSDRIEMIVGEQKFRRTRRKDLLFAQVALTHQLVTEEQIEEVFEMQESSFKSNFRKAVPSLGALLVERGIFSVHDNNRIVMAIQNNNSRRIEMTS
tara:strand:+ start:100 stop:990 length:891 start_codon:yes stop_codon:yes gene_type:complete